MDERILKVSELEDEIADDIQVDTGWIVNLTPPGYPIMSTYCWSFRVKQNAMLFLELVDAGLAPHVARDVVNTPLSRSVTLPAGPKRQRAV